MIHIINLVLLISLLGFIPICELKEIDSEVNQKITQRFDDFDPSLWNELEDEFYSRLTDLRLMNSTTDSLEAFQNLMVFVTESGYPQEFFVDLGNSKTKRLINELDQIGFRQNDESANEFLYSLINPIIMNCENQKELSAPPRDMLVAFGTTNPDSIRHSYDLATLDFYKQYNAEDFQRPGLYKSMLIFYFSRMMNKKK